MKPTMYQVRTTPAIAQEMSRYEGNRIQGKTDPQDAESWEIELGYQTWIFTISGAPNLSRWESFGIRRDRIKIIR